MLYMLSVSLLFHTTSTPRVDDPCTPVLDGICVCLPPLGSEAGDKVPEISTSADAISAYSPQSSRPATSAGAGLSLTDVPASVDPFLHDSLRRPTVDVIVQKRLLKIIGSRSEMHQIANSYFASISRRLSIVSVQRFYGRLPNIESPIAQLRRRLCHSLCM
jgi:hypothetical protein